MHAAVVEFCTHFGNAVLKLEGRTRQVMDVCLHFFHFLYCRRHVEGRVTRVLRTNLKSVPSLALKGVFREDDYDILLPEFTRCPVGKVMTH